ncbi:MAG: hypothetical protein ACP5VE_03205 [Chthonomonadales bacterium]
MATVSAVCTFCSWLAAWRVTDSGAPVDVCYRCLPAVLARKGVSAEVIRFLNAWAPEASGEGAAVSGARLADNRARRNMCPACGLTWEAAFTSRLLGCPECYSAFNIVLPLTE